MTFQRFRNVDVPTTDGERGPLPPLCITSVGNQMEMGWQLRCLSGLTAVCGAAPVGDAPGCTW